MTPPSAERKSGHCEYNDSTKSPPRSSAMAVPKTSFKTKLGTLVPEGLKVPGENEQQSQDSGFRPWGHGSAEPLTGLSNQEGLREMGEEYLPVTTPSSNEYFLRGQGRGDVLGAIKQLAPLNQAASDDSMNSNNNNNIKNKTACMEQRLPLEPNYPSIASVTSGGDQYLPDEVGFSPSTQSPTLGLSDAEWKSIPFSTRRKIKVALEQGSPLKINPKDLAASFRSPQQISPLDQHRNSNIWSAPVSNASSLKSGDSSLAASPSSGPHRQIPFSKRRRDRAVTMYPSIEASPQSLSLSSLDNKMMLNNATGLSRSTSLSSSSLSSSSAAIQFLSKFSGDLTTTSGAFNTSIAESELGEQVGDYIIGKMIGYGSFSQVREATMIDTQTGKKIVRAVKVVQKANPQSTTEVMEKIQHEFDQEIAIWKTLDHEHILKLLSVEETDRATYCFADKITGGTLFDAIRSCRGRLDPLLAKKYLFQLGSALLYLHETMHIVHRDVKLENCLLEEAGLHEYKVVLCDFGMSDYFEIKEPIDSTTDITLSSEHPHHQNIIGPSETSSILNQFHHLDNENHDTVTSTTPIKHNSDKNQDVCDFTSMRAVNDDSINGSSSPDGSISASSTSHFGSIPYAAPELLISTVPIFEPHIDVWAFGVVGHALFMGRLPWQHTFLPKLRTMILEGHWNKHEFEVKAGRDIQQVISGCLMKDISQRFKFRDFMNKSFWME